MKLKASLSAFVFLTAASPIFGASSQQKSFLQKDSSNGHLEPIGLPGVQAIDTAPIDTAPDEYAAEEADYDAEDLYERYPGVEEIEEYGGQMMKFHKIFEQVAASLGLRDAGPDGTNWETDLTVVGAPHFAHEGKSPSISVPYEIKEDPGMGVGIFATAPIKKGQEIWNYREVDHVEIVKDDMPVLNTMLKQVNPEVAKWFMRWTYVTKDGSDPNGSMLFEMDDGRYANEPAPGKQATMVSVGDDNVANRDIEPGEEITEDYASSKINWEPGWFDPLYDEFDHHDKYQKGSGKADNEAIRLWREAKDKAAKEGVAASADAQ